MIFLIISTARLRSHPQNDITFGIEFTRECKILSAWLLVFYRLKIPRRLPFLSPFLPGIVIIANFSQVDFGAQHWGRTWVR
jgi:hypothetical protein